MAGYADYSCDRLFVCKHTHIIETIFYYTIRRNVYDNDMRISEKLLLYVDTEFTECLELFFYLPVLKKESIGSCVPLCELHFFATSCYKNRSKGLVSAMFSATVFHS